MEKDFTALAPPPKAYMSSKGQEAQSKFKHTSEISKQNERLKIHTKQRLTRLYPKDTGGHSALNKVGQFEQK